MAERITIEEALALVKSGDYVVSGLGATEGREFMTNLHTIADRVRGVTVSNCLPMSDYEFIVNPKYKESFKIESWFYNCKNINFPKDTQAIFALWHAHQCGLYANENRGKAHNVLYF